MAGTGVTNVNVGRERERELQRERERKLQRERDADRDSGRSAADAYEARSAAYHTVLATDQAPAGVSLGGDTGWSASLGGDAGWGDSFRTVS